MRRTIELTGFNGLSAAGTLAGNLPISLDYIALYIQDTGATAVIGDITDHKVIANADILRQSSGAFQNGLNILDRLAAMSADNIFTIPFQMMGMKTIESSYATTLNTGSPDPRTGKTINQARFEMTNTTAAPAWRVFAEVDDAGEGGPGWTERIKVFVNAVAGTAEQGFQQVLPFGTEDVRFLRRVGVDLSAGAPTLVRVLKDRDNKEIFKRTQALNDRILAQALTRTRTGTGFEFVLDTTESGIAETFDTMIDTKNGPVSCGVFDLRITNSAAAAVNFVWDTLGTF